MITKLIGRTINFLFVLLTRGECERRVQENMESKIYLKKVLSIAFGFFQG